MTQPDGWVLSQGREGGDTVPLVVAKTRAPTEALPAADVVLDVEGWLR